MLLQTLCDMLVMILDSWMCRNAHKNKNERKSTKNYTCLPSLYFCKAGTLRNTQALWDSKIKEQHAT